MFSKRILSKGGPSNSMVTRSVTNKTRIMLRDRNKITLRKPKFLRQLIIIDVNNIFDVFYDVLSAASLSSSGKSYYCGSKYVWFQGVIALYEHLKFVRPLTEMICLISTQVNKIVAYLICLLSISLNKHLTVFVCNKVNDCNIITWTSINQYTGLETIWLSNT